MIKIDWTQHGMLDIAMPIVIEEILDCKMPSFESHLNTFFLTSAN